MLLLLLILFELLVSLILRLLHALCVLRKLKKVNHPLTHPLTTSNQEMLAHLEISHWANSNISDAQIPP